MPKNRPPIKWQEPGAKHRRNQQAVVKMMAQAPICHCEGALRPWQSRAGTADSYNAALKWYAPIASVAALSKRLRQLQVSQR